MKLILTIYFCYKKKTTSTIVISKYHIDFSRKGYLLFYLNFISFSKLFYTYLNFKLRTTSYTNIFIGDKYISGRYTFSGYNSIAFKVLKSLQSKYGITLISILLEQEINDFIDNYLKEKNSTLMMKMFDWLIESRSINVNDVNKNGETFLIRILGLNIFAN